MTTQNASIQIIADEDRMDFLPQSFGRLYLAAEQTLYNLANKYLKLVIHDGAEKAYTGGHWEFAKSPSGAPFLFPKHGGETIVTNPITGDEQRLSCVLAGAYLTMLTLQTIFTSKDWKTLPESLQDRLIDAYHDLKGDGSDAMAATDDERRAFFRLTD